MTTPKMTYGSLPGIDKPLSRLIMGTMVVHTSQIPYSFALLDHFYEKGGTALDTAFVYGGGESEPAVGQWITSRGLRDQIVLIAKGAATIEATPEMVTHEMLASLDRFGLEYADLYLMHRDNPTVPVGEFVQCLNEHQKAGRIKAFGGSNWTQDRLQAANEYARAHGLTPFVASSPNFSLAIQNEPTWADCISASSLAGEREWYAQNNFPLLSWSSQAQGFFTGRYAKDAPTDSEMVRVWYNDGNFERLHRATEMAQKKGVTPIQIALAYVLCQPFPTFALIGPRTREETESTMEGLEVTLTPSELAWLNLEA